MPRRYLTASSEYLELSAAVATAVPLSMFCWFMPFTIGSTYSIIAVANNGATTGYFVLEATTSGTLRVRTNDGTGSSDAISTEAMVANKWYACGGAFNAINDRRGYLQGVKVTNNGSRTPSGLNRTSIGRKSNSSSFNYVNGVVATPAFWSATLNDAEMLALAQGENPMRIRPESLLTKFGRTDLELFARDGTHFAPTGTAPWGNPPPLLSRRRCP